VDSTEVEPALDTPLRWPYLGQGECPDHALGIMDQSWFREPRTNLDSG